MGDNAGRNLKPAGARRLEGGTGADSAVCIYARGILTTTLTAKGAHMGAKYTLRWTDYCTRLLSLDAGGLYSVSTENRQG